MTATTVWVLIIVALAAAGGFVAGRIGRDETVSDANREQTRADLLAAHLGRAVTKLYTTRRLTRERPEWLPEPRHGRWTPNPERRRAALKQIGRADD